MFWGHLGCLEDIHNYSEALTLHNEQFSDLHLFCFELLLYKKMFGAEHVQTRIVYHQRDS